MGDAPKTLDAIVENVVSSPQYRSLITVIENGQDSANQQTTRFATGQNANQQTTGLSTEQCNSGVQQTSVASTTTQSSNRWCQAFACPVAEFNAIFRRGASPDQLQRGSGTVSSFLPNLTQRSRTRQSSAWGRRRQSAHTPGHRKSNSVCTRDKKVTFSHLICLSPSGAINIYYSKYCRNYSLHYKGLQSIWHSLY